VKSYRRVECGKTVCLTNILNSPAEGSRDIGLAGSHMRSVRSLAMPDSCCTINEEFQIK
jgi:hypothetical protein